MKRNSVGCFVEGRHTEIADHDCVPGVAGEKFSGRCISVERAVRIRVKRLRIDGGPRSFPQNICGRTAEAEVSDVASAEEDGEIDDAIGKTVAAAIVPGNGLGFAGRHLEGEASVDGESDSRHEGGLRRYQVEGGFGNFFGCAESSHGLAGDEILASCAGQERHRDDGRARVCRWCRDTGT